MKKIKYMAVLLICAGIANAAIITPTSVNSSGSYSGAIADAGTSLDSLRNGSGLSGTPVDDGTTAGGVTHVGGYADIADKWVTATPGADFFASADGTVQLDFNLGGTYDIANTYIWGYFNWGAGNSATAIDVSFSTDGGVSYGNTQSISLGIPPVNDLPANVVDLSSAPAGVTHVRFLMTDNGYDGGVSVGGGDRVGLGEVRFGTTTVAPSPVVISSFTANPLSVTNGGTSTLSWLTTNADTLTLDPGGIDVTGLTSTQVVVTAETAYTLTAANSLGSTNTSVTVTIQEEVAGIIIQPTDVVSEEFVFNSATDTINNDRMDAPVNNGDSLTLALGTAHEFGGHYDGSYVSTDRNGVTNFFLPTGDNSPVDIVYDLTSGGDTPLSDIVLWNYENNGGGGPAVGNSLRTVEVRINTEAEGASTFSGPATMITLLPVVDGDAIATNDLGGVNSAQLFSLGAQNGRYVQLSLTGNYLGFQDIDGGGDRVGLGEVRFVTGTFVVEPIGTITITGPVATSGGQGMVLSWDTQAEQSYDVQAKSNLISELTWTTITNVTGTGSGMTVTTAVDNAETFYQVVTPE